LDPGDGFGVVDVVVADKELLEQGLVDETADFLGRLLVAHLGVAEQRQGLIERLHDLGGVVRGYLAPSLCLAALSFDAGLLGLQNLLADAAFVEKVQELLLLAVQFLEPAGMAVGLALRRLHVALGVFPNRYANCLLLASSQADSGVVVHDGSLDAGGLNVASSAGVFTSSLMAETAEVVIDAAFASDSVEDHPASAVAAVDRPPQIVLVLACAVAAEHR
jgi:hypothetical protein